MEVPFGPKKEFMNTVDHYINENWVQDNQTVSKLSALISENKEIIENCVESPSDRQKLSELAIRIKEEFPENPEAQKIANDISSHVNAVFFKMSDPVKQIFSSLIPEIDSPEPKSGLEDVTATSKSFQNEATEVKNKWIQDELISLKIYGIQTADEAVQFIIDNKLTKVNLEDFPDFSQKNLDTLSNQNIHTLKIDSAHINKWPKIDSLKKFTPLYATNNQILNIGESFQNLESIDLSEIDKRFFLKVTGNELVKLLEDCPKLNQINLSGIFLRDEDLTTFTEKTFPNLKNIDLSYNKITGDGLIALKAFPNLQEISLIGNELKAVDFLELLKSSPNLQSLNFPSNQALVGVGGITNKLTSTLEMLEKPHLNLTNLDLPGIFAKDDDLMAIAKAFPKLQSINLYNMYHSVLTNKGIDALVKASPGLKEVFISKRQATKMNLDELKQTNPDLAIRVF